MNLSALYPVSKPEQPEPHIAQYSSDLRQAILRRLILLTFGACFVLFLIAQLTADWLNVVGVTLVLGATGLLVALSLRLQSSRPAIASAVWICGSIIVVVCAMVIFQQPLVGIVYVLFPLMATVLFGVRVGILAEVAIVLLLMWVVRGGPGQSMPGPLALALAAGGAAGVLVGWGIAYELTQLARWSGVAMEEARREVEDAHNQKVELNQTQQDLIRANRELARLSDQLKALNQVAEDARRVKEEFVANVSHELRTPLNMIIGFSDLITQMPQTYGGKLPPELLADIAAIQRNSQHLSKLVDDVLDLSQIDSGRMALTKEWCNLRDVIDESMLAVRALYESKHLYLQAECPPDMPRVFCDSTRIRQVLLNLLSNAGRFTERGGVRIEVSAEADSAEANQVVVSVADTGPGIAPEDQARIFEPFQQLDASIRRRHGGSGLGLAISKRFVEMHDGKLWLESETGRGTTFYFSLPTESPLPKYPAAGAGSARRWINPHQPYESRTRPFQAPVPDVLPRFVLLETDNTISQLVSRYVADAEDAEVVSVRDVAAALCELKRSPAQALIVNSADPDRLTSLRAQLATLPYSVPLIQCWLPGKSATEKRLGVLRYMLKPIAREALISAIGEVGDAVRVNTILLVDDDTEVLQLFTRMLTSADRAYRVLQASDGTRALALLRERKPDLVLLDLVMPGMDGWQFLREKQQDARISDIPVIAISAQDPVGEPMASETLTVTRKGGFAAQDLLACVRAVSESLSPAAQVRLQSPTRLESLGA